MRYVQYLIVPNEGTLHPLERILAEDTLTTRKAIHHLNLRDDGTIVGLYEFEGDVDHLETAFEDHPDMLSSRLSRIGSTVYSHAHTRTNEVVRRLLEIQNEHTLITDMPIEYTATGDLRVVSIGDIEMFRRAADAVPETVDIRLEGTGQWVPVSRRLFARLTDRQQETLRVAADLGYFANPRQATYDDVADEMDIAPETVGEHLRKAQAKLVDAALPDAVNLHPS
jgi:predicted DNA binding protein